MRKKIRINEEEDIEITPNMNLGIKSPLEDDEDYDEKDALLDADLFESLMRRISKVVKKELNKL